MLVLGDGRLGQLCALVLARAGAPPVVCGRHPKKLERLGKFGLETVTAAEGLPRGFDLVIDVLTRYQEAGCQAPVMLFLPAADIAGDPGVRAIAEMARQRDDVTEHRVDGYVVFSVKGG